VLPSQALLQQFEQPVASASASSTSAVATRVDETREGFSIGSLHLAIRYEYGSMLTDPPTVVQLPNAPAWFTGMSNIDGALVPVFDLAELLGAERAPGAKQMLLVLGHGDEQAGILVDGIPRRLRLTAESRLEEFAPAPHLAGCIAGVYRLDGTDWMDLKHSALLDRLVELLAR
jgi:purine-binding chemotaxis protein CheW